MNHHIDDEAEDKATRQNEAAAMAAQHDFEHWSKTGEVRRKQSSAGGKHHSTQRPKEGDAGLAEDAGLSESSSASPAARAFVSTGKEWATDRKCPKCGGEMRGRSMLGYDRHGQEQEADWDECVKCGHTE